MGVWGVGLSLCHPPCVPGLQILHIVRSRSSPQQRNNPEELLAMVPQAALLVPEQLFCNTTTAKVQGLALGLLQKCNLMKLSGRGEVTALLSALCSSLHPPAHHKPNTPHGTLIPTLPASNQPAIPSQHTFLHLPALWHPKRGKNQLQHHF